jgi:AcrR family transcriptional regulator
MAGRPRSADLDVALTDATAQLLAEIGYIATTVDAIAARAGVPKSALYRRWSSKAELVFATVVHGPVIMVPDTGALGSDLVELARRIVATLTAPAARQALPGLLVDLANDPKLVQRFHDDVIGKQRALVQSVIDRAVARGELDESIRADDLHAQLLGTAYAWTALVGEPAPRDLPERLAGAAHAVLIRRDRKCSMTSCPSTTSPNDTNAASRPPRTRRGPRSPH